MWRNGDIFSFFTVALTEDSLLDPDGGSVNTCTITTIQHPKWINGEIFEYQHSAGSDLPEPFAKRFEMWEQTDFAVLKEVGKEKPDGLPQFIESSAKRVARGQTENQTYV